MPMQGVLITYLASNPTIYGPLHWTAIVHRYNNVKVLSGSYHLNVGYYLRSLIN